MADPDATLSDLLPVGNPADASTAAAATLAEMLSAELPSSTADSSSATRISSKHTFSSPSTTTYLSHLTTLPIETLFSEPSTLSSTSAQLTNALTTLCHTNYRTFLSLHTTTTTLSSTLTSLTSSLSSLLDTALPALENTTRSFGEESKSVLSERRKAAVVLDQYDKLRDLLEIPTLVDACVRNGYFQEALDLSAHTTTLAQRFPDIPVISDVKAEVNSTIRTMLAQLLSTLREQAKLPALFKAVNFLRRMGVLDEDELALAFLSSRMVYLNSALETAETEKKGANGRDKERDKECYARYIRKYVDVWREGVYDLITQYTTIFLERAPSTSSSSAIIRTLLSTLTSNLLARLLTTLRTNLCHIRSDPSILSSLLTQLTYCATSFARVGMDFKAHLAPIFCDEVKASVTEGVREAETSFMDRLRKNTKNPSEFFLGSSAVSDPPLPALDFSLDASPPHVAPHILASYPVFAQYTNGLLTTLNGLRLLAPVELLDDLVQILDRSLAESTRAFLRHSEITVGEQTHADADKEVRVVRAAGQVYVKVFVPFVRRALVEGVYGVKVEGNRGMSRELKEAIDEWKKILQDGIEK